MLRLSGCWGLGAQMPDQGANLLLLLQGCFLAVQFPTHCGCAGPRVSQLCGGTVVADSPESCSAAGPLLCEVA